MSLKLLDRVNYGYHELEPVVVGLMAMHRSFMLIGRHGTGKTRLARVLSRGYGDKGFVFYDATKDDLISIAGIPDPESLRKGRLHFVPHERSIWDKSTIVVDEITRAGKESQNLWLEILEDRSCFGLPLAYRTVVATANPESYAAAFQLDEALLDRFHAVIPVPEQQEGVGAADVQAMIELAAGSQAPLEPTELARVFAEIQAAHASLVAKGAVARVGQYLGKVVPVLLKMLREQNGPYVSPRTYCRNVPETILAVAAYHQVAGAPEPLRRGAVDALRYALATKYQIKPVVLDQIHQSAEGLLTAGELPESEKIRMQIAMPATFEQRLEFLQAGWKSIQSALPADEVEKVLGELLRGASKKGDQEKLVVLKHALDELGYKGDALRQLDGRLLIALNGAINAVMPKLARILDARPGDEAIANIESFRAMVAAGTFIGNQTPEVRKLKAWLIDLREGDVPDDPESICTFFARLQLPR
jgi:hypothetical protein